MYEKVFLCGSLSIALFLAACKKDNNNNNNVSSTDQSFMAQVSMGNTGEIGAANSPTQNRPTQA